MGCQKLTYQTTEPSLKVVYRKSVKSENIAQRFLSLDPYATNNINYSPYNYVLGNPVTLVDPDGKDSRVAVERNEGGGGTITISTVAYVYGKNADAVAEAANTEISQLNTSSTYTDKNGDVWTVELDLEFKVKQELMDLDPEKKGIDYSQAKNTNGVREGDNFVCSDCMPVAGAAEDAQLGGSRTNAPIKSAAVHGVLHNIGFKDTNIKGDVMYNTIGPKRDNIDQSHFENAAKTVLGEIEYYKDYPTMWSPDINGVIFGILKGIATDDNEHTQEQK